MLAIGYEGFISTIAASSSALFLELLDVEGHLNVSGIHILVLQDDGVEFVRINSSHKKIRLIRSIRRFNVFLMRLQQFHRLPVGT